MKNWGKLYQFGPWAVIGIGIKQFPDWSRENHVKHVRLEKD